MSGGVKKGLSGARNRIRISWHRYYDPATGRYLTPDPIGLEGGINLFVYANNNPVNWIDPEGLEVFDKGSYTFKKHPKDIMHGGKHWHVHKRKGGKLLGRVSLEGKVITGKVPNKALKILAGLGKIGGAVIGIVLELSLPAEAGDPSDMLSGPFVPPAPPSIEMLPLKPRNDSPCK